VRKPTDRLTFSRNRTEQQLTRPMTTIGKGKLIERVFSHGNHTRFSFKLPDEYSTAQASSLRETFSISKHSSSNGESTR
jgi:hypothetical protein